MPCGNRASQRPAASLLSTAISPGAVGGIATSWMPVTPVRAGASLAGKDSSDASSTGANEGPFPSIWVTAQAVSRILPCPQSRDARVGVAAKLRLRPPTGPVTEVLLPSPFSQPRYAGAGNFQGTP